jgi:hypothetical protein
MLRLSSLLSDGVQRIISQTQEAFLNVSFYFSPIILILQIWAGVKPKESALVHWRSTQVLVMSFNKYTFYSDNHSLIALTAICASLHEDSKLKQFKRHACEQAIKEKTPS